MAFVFSKLDKRTRQLVKNGENALKHLDASLQMAWIEQGLPHPLELFALDDATTTVSKRVWPFLGAFSYSRCFKYVFVGFGVLGAAGAISALVYFPINAAREENRTREAIYINDFDSSDQSNGATVNKSEQNGRK